MSLPGQEGNPEEGGLFVVMCRMFPSARPLLFGALSLGVLVLVGCGSGASAKVLHGSVTCGEEKVPMGVVSFVPIEGASGPTCAARIVDGQYRVEARGGVPLGKHRVQVDARKKTGRKVQGSNGREVAVIDETARMGPAVYAGEQSPLVVNVGVDCDGAFDIAIPR
jgi:hypothetical protein